MMFQVKGHRLRPELKALFLGSNPSWVNRKAFKEDSNSVVLICVIPMERRSFRDRSIVVGGNRAWGPDTVAIVRSV